MDGTDCIAEIPRTRWDWEEYYDKNMDAPGKTYSKWAGFIAQEPEMFDNIFFGITPKEAERLDPQQRILLEVSWEAMETSGHHLDATHGAEIGVFIGICSNDFQMMQTAKGDKSLCDAYYGTGNANSCASGRIASRAPSPARSRAASSRPACRICLLRERSSDRGGAPG